MSAQDHWKMDTELTNEFAGICYDENHDSVSLNLAGIQETEVGAETRKREALDTSPMSVFSHL